MHILRRGGAIIPAVLLAAVLLFAKGPAGKLFLWEVKSKTATVYLLGSVHLGTEDIYPMDDSIEKAFEEADTLVVEFDINNADQAMMQRFILTKGVYLDGTTLQQHVPEEIFRRLNEFATERGLDIQQILPMRPWLAALMLPVMEMQRLGYDPDYGIDQHFLDQAGDGKKKIVELESADFQLDLLSSFSAELQVASLEQALDEMKDLEVMIGRIMGAWSSGDTARLEELIFSSWKDREDLAPLYDRLYTERNVSMAASIREMLSGEGTYFVVVGAGHLIGPDGIIQVLARDGKGALRVRQVEPTGKPAPEPEPQPTGR